MQRSNFHTHTTYSDGKKSPREVIEAAIAAMEMVIPENGEDLVK